LPGLNGGGAAATPLVKPLSMLVYITDVVHLSQPHD